MSSVNRPPRGALNWTDRLQADLVEPEVPAIIKDENGQEDETGLIPRSAIDSDLELIVAPWPAEPYTNTVKVGWRTAGAQFEAVNEYTYFNPVFDPDNPQPKIMHVPYPRLEQGTYELSYKVSVRGNEVESLKKTVTIDRRPPDDGQTPDAPSFPAEVEQAGSITDEYLNDHGEVVMSVPRYTDMRAKDKVIYYWTDRNPPPNNETPTGEYSFSKDDIDNGNLNFSLTESVIRTSGQGQRFAYYQLEDLAGNKGPISLLAAIDVLLIPAPGNLQPPHIPLSSRGLIDREHAREGATDEAGVTVQINAYDNPDSSQKVLINWDGTLLNELDVDPAGFPLRAYVPWSALTAKGLGPLDVQVSYQVRYGNALTPPSSTATAPVNLTIAGQDHANAPALLNMTLAKLEVRGKQSDLPNQLTALDHGLDATATLTLYDNPKALEVLEVYWGDIAQPVTNYTVAVGDNTGKIVTFEIPWSAIEQDMDNQALPVYYTTDNGVNQQLSRVTDVNVKIEPIAGLKEPSFPHADLFGYLNCCAVPRLWEGVTVHIEGSPQFAANDRVVMTWQGCDSLNGTNPISGATDTFTRTLNASDAVNGFDIVVLPYDTLIGPMRDNGSATAQYELYKADGGYGRSAMDFVKITRLMPSGEECTPDNDICDE